MIGEIQNHKQQNTNLKLTQKLLQNKISKWIVTALLALSFTLMPFIYFGYKKVGFAKDHNDDMVLNHKRKHNTISRCKHKWHNFSQSTTHHISTGIENLLFYKALEQALCIWFGMLYLSFVTGYVVRVLIWTKTVHFCLNVIFFLCITRGFEAFDIYSVAAKQISFAIGILNLFVECTYCMYCIFGSFGDKQIVCILLVIYLCSNWICIIIKITDTIHYRMIYFLKWTPRCFNCFIINWLQTYRICLILANIFIILIKIVLFLPALIGALSVSIFNVLQSILTTETTSLLSIQTAIYNECIICGINKTVKNETLRCTVYDCALFRFMNKLSYFLLNNSSDTIITQCVVYQI